MGDCNIDRPSGFFDVEGKAKWDAWSSVRACPAPCPLRAARAHQPPPTLSLSLPRRSQVKGTSKEDAQKAYIALVTKLLGA